MPVFGKSLFETVLDGMEPEPIEEDEEIAIGRPRVVAHFLADTSFGEHPEERPFVALYEDFEVSMPAEPQVPDLPVAPDWLERLSEKDVSDDLALTETMTAAEIRESRRGFALSNHPDRVAEGYREAATIRMTIANRLVEAALRRAG